MKEKKQNLQKRKKKISNPNKASFHDLINKHEDRRVK